MAFGIGCCWYSIRRYDPLGGTMWAQDYTVGSPHPGQPSRSLVVGSTLYVVSSLYYTDSTDTSTYWNMAAYDLPTGKLLWRKMPAYMDHLSDIVTVNGKYYVLGAGTGYLGNQSIYEVDLSGNMIQSWSIWSGATRLCVGDPGTTYTFSGGLVPLPPGLLLWNGGVPDQLANYAIYNGGSFLVFPAAWGQIPSNPFSAVLASAEPPSWANVGGPDVPSGRIDQMWMNNNPGWSGIFFAPIAAPGNRFASPSDIAFDAETGDWFFAVYQGSGPGGFRGTGQYGAVARISGDGNTLRWIGSSAQFYTVSTDNIAGLYCGGHNNGYPTIERRDSATGECVWGHIHNDVAQVIAISADGCVTLGTRYPRGAGQFYVPDP